MILLSQFLLQGNVYGQRAIIALNGVEIYSLPMIDDTPVTVLSRGDTVHVIGQRGEWVKIEFTKGKKGWMQVQVQRGKEGLARPKAPQRRRAGQSGWMADNRISDDLMKGSLGESQGNSHSGNGLTPDVDIRRPKTASAEPGERRPFGYSFGIGLLEGDFEYEWKFLFHTTPRLALVGSFRHALGDAANSYFIMANWDYLLKDRGDFLPFVTGGMGIINTVIERDIDLGGVSHMALNYGIGARKKYRGNTSLTFKAAAYTVFVGKGIRHYKEFSVGFMVGKFWD